MALTNSKMMADRLRHILAKDKVNVKDGFIKALSGDCQKLLNDYFDLNEQCKIEIDQDLEGVFCVNIQAKATRIKQFDTTMDYKRF